MALALLRVPGRAAAAAALAGLALAGCGSGGPAHGGAGGGAPDRTARPGATAPVNPGGPMIPAAGPDWPTYHFNAQRTGDVTGLPPAGALSVRWSASLRGAVYGQPLIIGGTVIAATEANRVYGLSRATGRVLWDTEVASGRAVPLSDQPCGDIDPLGITGTPVYDPATRLVYAVAETAGGAKLLAGISVATGRVELTRTIPAPDHEPAYDQQRGALALAAGHIYVTFGGHFGDCGPYRGSVVSVPAAGHGPLRSYVVPTRKQGGIWATGGPVVAPDGTIYVASGNGAAFSPPFDGSDSVIALTAGLRRAGVFAPSRWAADNSGDLDLGSASPALLPDGQLLQVGKSGIGYLLSGTHLGGVGGQLAQGRVCASFGGPAVRGHIVYVPCYGAGLTAVSVAGDRVRVLWRGPATASGSPVVGGGAVWVADWASGTLYELSPATGQVRHQVRLGSALPHFASPSLSGGLVLIGTTHGVVAVSGA
jgi:outer membrane protein assembly factor BamB